MRLSFFFPENKLNILGKQLRKKLRANRIYLVLEFLYGAVYVENLIHFSAARENTNTNYLFFKNFIFLL